MNIKNTQMSTNTYFKASAKPFHSQMQWHQPNWIGVQSSDKKVVKKSEASGGLLGQACNRNTNKMNYGCFQKYFGRHMIMFATLNPITVLYSAITVIWQILEGLLHTLQLRVSGNILMVLNLYSTISQVHNLTSL